VLAPTTALIVLIALNQRATPDTNKQVAILEGDQLAQALAHEGDDYRPLFEFLAYTGLRIGEALGLTWADIDYDNA
jgi:integrase